MHRISNHPVHIGYGENYSPSAFIPFCSFGGNISIMGTKIPEFGIPVCSKFKPTVLGGQLCYQIDINEFVNQVDSKKLMTHGLIILLDYNEDRLGLDMNIDSNNSVDEALFDFKANDQKKKEAMIYIETMGMYKL